MKSPAYYLLVIHLVLWCAASYAQVDTRYLPDRLIDSTRTLSNSIIQKFDSTKRSHLPNTDTLAYYRQRIDSVTAAANQQLNSIKYLYTKEISQITDYQNRLRSKIDSLKQRALTTSSLTAKLDSTQQRITSLNQGFEKKISDVKNQTLTKIDALKLPPELKSDIDKIQNGIDKIVPDQLPGRSLSLLPGTNTLPSIPSLPNSLPLGSSVGNLTPPKLPDNMPGVKSLPNLETPKIKDLPQTTALSDASSKIETPMSTVKAIQSRPIDKLVDNKLADVDQVKAIQERAQIAGVSSIQSEKAFKAELEKKARRLAADHFSDKQLQLKAAMEKLAKYKVKYNEVSSIADVKKNPPNPMKEKSLVQRLIPGVNFQILKKDDNILFDINPYVGYRFTRRFTAGAGWNERIAYNWNGKQLNSDARIFGPRIYGEYSLSKGFSPRLEFEMMNSRVPPATVKQGDPYDRKWVSGVFIGIKKQYKIAGPLHGTAAVMFRIYDPQRQSPYGDVVNARFGLEYLIKGKKQEDKAKKQTTTK